MKYVVGDVVAFCPYDSNIKVGVIDKIENGDLYDSCSIKTFEEDEGTEIEKVFKKYEVDSDQIFGKLSLELIKDLERKELQNRYEGVKAQAKILKEKLDGK